MNNISHPAKMRPRASSHNDIAPAGTPPHIAVAPGLLEQAHVAIRHEGDTDDDHAANERLLAAVLDYARKV